MRSKAIKFEWTRVDAIPYIDFNKNCCDSITIWDDHVQFSAVNSVWIAREEVSNNPTFQKIT